MQSIDRRTDGIQRRAISLSDDLRSLSKKESLIDYLSKIATILVPFCNQRKNESLQSDGSSRQSRGNPIDKEKGV